MAACEPDLIAQMDLTAAPENKRDQIHAIKFQKIDLKREE